MKFRVNHRQQYSGKPDIDALDSALKVKQFINATKSNNQIKTLQERFTRRAAPIAMTQMVYDTRRCNNNFIKKALETINYCA